MTSRPNGFVLLPRNPASRQRFTVAGVLPPTFRFTYPLDTELWTPLPPDASTTPSLFLRYTVVARLQDGVHIDDARADLSAVAAEMANELGGRFSTSDVRLEPIHEYAVGQARPALALLATVTAIVLLTAALNVATLLLALAISQRRELALPFAHCRRRARHRQQAARSSTAERRASMCARLEPHGRPRR